MIIATAAPQPPKRKKKVSNNSNASTGGIGFFGALGLLFIGLKLGGVIDWSWWLVLLPLYGPLALFLAISGLVLAGVGVCVLVDKLRA